MAYHCWASMPGFLQQKGNGPKRTLMCSQNIRVSQLEWICMSELHYVTWVASTCFFPLPSITYVSELPENVNICRVSPNIQPNINLSAICSIASPSPFTITKPAPRSLHLRVCAIHTIWLYFTSNVIRTTGQLTILFGCYMSQLSWHWAHPSVL